MRPYIVAYEMRSLVDSALIEKIIHYHKLIIISYTT